MGENTKIEWCDHTFNPWIGCTKVSPGCANCYAETLMDKRLGKVNWGPGNPRQRTSAANWKKVEQWNRRANDVYAEWESAMDDRDSGATLANEPRKPRVFVASLADWLDPEAPIEWLADLLDLIRRCPHLDFLMLTKRPELWRDRLGKVDTFLAMTEPNGTSAFPGNRLEWLRAWLDASAIPNNIWIGFSAENQEWLNKRIHHAEQIPAVVYFISMEPMLEAIEVWPQYINWIIVGGESGPRARAFDPDWARGILAQCRTSDVRFFMKQMGGARKPFPEIPGDLQIREFPEGEWRERCKAAIDAAKGGSDE